MTTAIFLLRAHGQAAIVGAALICPEARYCSVRARGAERLDRRFATPRDWRAIEAELVSLPSGRVSSQSVIARVVAGRDLHVTYLVTEDLPEPADVAATLDAKLSAQPLDELDVRLKQQTPTAGHHAVVEAYQKARERGLTENELDREKTDPDSQLWRDAREAIERVRKPRPN